MKYILIIILLISIIGLIYYYQAQQEKVEKVGNVIQLVMEYSYFEGQLDAMNGDIRIGKLDSGKYEWLKSPWDNRDKEILYNPNENIFEKINLMFEQ